MSIDAVFIKIVNMSIAANWLILAVILARFLLKKAPKRMTCLLWALAFVRLVCPFSPESALSLIPSSETIPEEIFFYEGPLQHVPAWIDAVDNPAFLQSVVLPAGQTVSVVQTRAVIWTLIWLAGTCALLLYAFISIIRLKRSVRASIPVNDNVLACDEVKSPFILGVIRPLIYVPSSMTGMTLGYVMTHENAHIQRGDHLWKPLGFLILAVYWFDPFCWIAYVLFCRDIEMACDERVIRNMDKGSIAGYSQALLDCSFPRRRIAVCPLAFGEVSVKERVKSVLNYKKPAFWVIALSAAVCIAVALCFMTDPKDNAPDLSFLNYENACPIVSDVEAVDTIWYPPVKKNEDGKISIGYVSGKELAKYLDLLPWQKRRALQEGLPSPGSIEFCIEEDYRITVYQNPRLAMVRYGDEVRYYKTGSGDYDAAVSLFRKGIPDVEKAPDDPVPEEMNPGEETGGAAEMKTYTYNVAFANWSEDSRIYARALNSGKMIISSVQHLPVYKIDTKAELDSFKKDFGDILSMDGSYDEVPSFEYITATYDDSFFSE